MKTPESLAPGAMSGTRVHVTRSRLVAKKMLWQLPPPPLSQSYSCEKFITYSPSVVRSTDPEPSQTAPSSL